jgi:2-polyprenyl-6-methoxyphenol hydroxylase-like FAD-dependent oxidoreductase
MRTVPAAEIPHLLWASADREQPRDPYPDRLSLAGCGQQGPPRCLVTDEFQSDFMFSPATAEQGISVWGQGRGTLLGDAIHATTPNLGQGACMALEDAVVLAQCLRTIPQPVQALRAYEDMRRERTSRVTRQSRSLEKLFQAQNWVIVKLRNWIFRTRFGNNRAKKLFAELLSYNVPTLTQL